VMTKMRSLRVSLRPDRSDMCGRDLKKGRWCSYSNIVIGLVSGGGRVFRGCSVRQQELVKIVAHVNRRTRPPRPRPHVCLHFRNRATSEAPRLKDFFRHARHRSSLAAPPRQTFFSQLLEDVATMSKTVHITSPQHFTQLLSSSRIVVTDCYADWCGPCKIVAPVYEQLSQQLSRPGVITFTKVDTDAQRTIAQTYNISAMPTFLIFKAGRETKRIVGADLKALDAAVKSLAEEAGKADMDDSVTGAGSSGEMWTGAAIPRSYSDITDAVDSLGLDFLNIDREKGDKRSIFAPGKPSGLNKGSNAKDFIESDTDEQLMLFIPFQSTLKLHSLHITSLPPSDDGDATRPKTLKLYTNRSTVLGFDEAEDTLATQEIQIKKSDWNDSTGTAIVELRFVKFQNITSLVIFVADVEGDGEKTRIDRIRLFGERGEKRAMGKLEKIGDEAGE